MVKARNPSRDQCGEAPIRRVSRSNRFHQIYLYIHTWLNYAIETRSNIFMIPDISKILARTNATSVHHSGKKNERDAYSWTKKKNYQSKRETRNETFFYEILNLRKNRLKPYQAKFSAVGGEYFEKIIFFWWKKTTERKTRNRVENIIRMYKIRSWMRLIMTPHVPNHRTNAPRTRDFFSPVMRQILIAYFHVDRYKHRRTWILLNERKRDGNRKEAEL